MSWVLLTRGTGEKNPDLRLQPPRVELIKKEQCKTQASQIYLTKDGAKDYKTKVPQDFLRQEGISHEVNERYCPQSNRLAEGLNLTIMDKVRCMLIDANSTPNSGLMLHIMQCSSTITSLILPSINTRVQMTLMETHPIFRSSTSSVLFVVLFNRQYFYISWRKD